MATFGMDGEIRFASVADRAAFAHGLAADVTRLNGRYHEENAKSGRDHRVIVALHPTLRPEQDRPER